MPSKPAPDRFLNYAQVAEMIGLAVKTVRNGECETHEIPRIKLGGRVLFSFNEVQAWMSRKAEEAREAQSKQKAVVRNLLASKDQIREAVNKTYLTLVNQRRHSK